MQRTELFKLACQCLILDEHPALEKVIRQKFADGKVDLFKFVRLCSNHLVLPAVYRRLEQSGIADYLPGELTEHLNDIYNLNKQRNSEILKQINEIEIQLSKGNIEFILLKGTANLLDNIYPDPGDRIIGDIDLIVRDEDYIKASELIIEAGYKHTSKIYYDIKEAKDFPRLFKDDVPADIEIHRVPVEIKYSKYFTTEMLFQEKKSTANKKNAFVCSNTHKLIHTFIHSQLSDKGYLYNNSSLRDMFDAYLISKQVELESAVRLIKEKKKADNFFEYVGYLFNPDNNVKKAPNRYSSRQLWFINHSRVHRWYYKLLKLYDLLINRYLIFLLKAFFNKNRLYYIRLKLSDSGWWKQHYKDLKKTFFS